MRCQKCGSTQVGLYKEIRSYIAECGITKEDIQKQINITIDSMIRSSISEKLDTYIEKAVHSKIRFLSPYDKSVKDIIKQTIEEIVAKQIADQLHIHFDLKKEISINPKTEN